MRRMIGAAAALWLGIAGAFGAEQVTLQIPLATIPCPGTSAGTFAGNQILKIENYINGLLPDPLYITRVVIWADEVGPITSATVGNIAVAVDPGSKYQAISGFPDAQKYEPQYLKSLGVLEMIAGGRRQQVENFNPPVAYRNSAGDSLIVAPYCTGGGTVSAGFLALFYQADADIPEPPSSPTYLYSQDYDTQTYGNSGWSLRSAVPAGVGGTKVRVRVVNRMSASQPVVKIDHMSVGVQFGSSSSTTAAPVELKFNNRSGVALNYGQWAWSDWTPLNVAAGEALLVTSSLFQPSNSWNLRATGGAGSWASQTDSWNSSMMLGTVNAQPGFTHVIDQVQIQ